MPVDEKRRRPAERDAKYAAKDSDERSLDDDRLHDGPPRYPHQPQRRNVAPPFLDLEYHDAKEKYGTGDNGDDSDRAMEPTHHLKGA